MKNKNIRPLWSAKSRNNMSQKIRILPALLAAIVLLSGCEISSGQGAQAAPTVQETETVQENPQISLESDILSWNGEDAIPVYSGVPWTEINGSIPYFSAEEKVIDVFENYSDLDSLGRCGQAYANICIELMPTEERGQIGQVKPSGWHTVKYPEQIKDLYLYNRCHLIGFQLAGENANEKNLVTGTRYLNIEGMLPFEDEIADHVHETSHHVLYRVTPLFTGDNLVCQGVEMEAFCVEDDGKTDGEGVSFHVFAYNVQPGIGIDYATGESWVEGDADAGNAKLDESVEVSAAEQGTETAMEYAININSRKFHFPECASVEKANPENIKYWTCTREELIEDGYSPCGACHP